MTIGPSMTALVAKVNDQVTVEQGMATTLTDFIARFQAFVDNANLGADDEAEANALLAEMTDGIAPLVAAVANIPPATPPAA